MLPTNLTTNEVKDSAGTEVEFLRLSTDARTLIFAKNGEAPNQPYRLKVSHQESGTGKGLRRRSLVRFDIPVTGVDASIETVSVYAVADIPVGNISDLTVPTKAIAHLNSLLSTTGAANTVLFDGTGYGSSALINGSL